MRPTGYGNTSDASPAPQDGTRWALSLALTVLGGLSWFIFGWGLVGGLSMVAVVAAILPATTCLAAGWLLRSRSGLVAALVAYVAASALIWVLAIVGVGDVQAWLVAFPLAVVLPGLVMAATGTAVGIYRSGQNPRLGQPAS